MPLSLSINLQKDSVKFGVKHILQQKGIKSDNISKASLWRVGNLPNLLGPVVLASIELPLESYQLELQEIRAIAIVSHRQNGMKFAISLSDNLLLNHPEPLFSTCDFTACLLDEKTVITVND